MIIIITSIIFIFILLGILPIYKENIKIKKGKSKPHIIIKTYSKQKSEIVEFLKYVNDNFSQNEKQGSKIMLPYWKMRLDFSDKIFTIEEIYEDYFET